MAIEVLRKNGSQFQHKPKHDLESLFYVLIYICTNLKGPRNMVRTKAEVLKEHSSVPLYDWFDMDASFRSLGRTKAGQFDTFQESILDKFSPYFADLAPCVMKLFRAFFPSGKEWDNSCISHAKMIAIFEETLLQLPHERTPQDRTSPSPRFVGVKRSSSEYHLDFEDFSHKKSRPDST